MWGGVGEGQARWRGSAAQGRSAGVSFDSSTGVPTHTALKAPNPPYTSTPTPILCTHLAHDGRHRERVILSKDAARA
jgi:hypothetical protein